MMTPMGVLPASTDSEVVVMALAFSYNITEGMELIDKMLNAFTDMLSGFEGIEEGCTVAISNVGSFRNENTRKLFLEGYEEMLKRIKPEKNINIW